MLSSFYEFCHNIPGLGPLCQKYRMTIMVWVFSQRQKIISRVNRKHVLFGLGHKRSIKYLSLCRVQWLDKIFGPHEIVFINRNLSSTKETYYCKQFSF